MAVIAIGAVGLTMQFGITNLINLAYGDVMITSAFAAYGLNSKLVSVWLALALGALWGAVLSFLLNRLLYAPFQRKGTSPIGMVIVSLAIGIMMSNVLLAVAGPDNVSYVQPAGPTLKLGAIVLTTEQVLIIGSAVVLMLAIHALLTFTRLGKA